MTEPEDMKTVSIRQKGPGLAAIVVQGRDLASFIRGYAVFVENPNDMPSVVLDFAPRAGLEYDGDAVVAVKPELAEVLEMLGWTPPELPDPTEDRPDDELETEITRPGDPQRTFLLADGSRRSEPYPQPSWLRDDQE
jgi:hypothetical protein